MHSGQVEKGQTIPIPDKVATVCIEWKNNAVLANKRRQRKQVLSALLWVYLLPAAAVQYCSDNSCRPASYCLNVTTVLLLLLP